MKTAEFLENIHIYVLVCVTETGRNFLKLSQKTLRVNQKTFKVVSEKFTLYFQEKMSRSSLPITKLKLGGKIISYR